MKEFGVEDGAVFISEVECTGSEEKLTVCPHKEAGDHQCSNAGVTCKKRHGGNGTVAGAVIGTLAFLVLAVIAVVVPLVFVSRKLRKKKQLERIQLDIHAL